jgi:DNA-binding MarR family transcriptional regulator
MNDMRAIRQAVRSTAFDEALAALLSLNPTDLRCLELAIEIPGLTAGRLAELSGLTSGAVTGVLDRLEKAGYVVRKPDPSDRRSVTIEPVATEVARVEAALAPLDARLDTELEGRSAAERAAVADFLAAAMRAVAEETARMTAGTRGGFMGDTFSAPLADATRGRLQFASGAPRLALNFAPLGPQATARVIMETSASRLAFAGPAQPGELVRASFDGPMPDVRASAGVVSIRYRRRAIAAFTSRSARIALSAEIPWTIELTGGITDITGTLEGVVLERVDVQGGANHVRLDLPAPRGTVGVRLAGVASSARFRRPAGVPAALRVDGGIAHLRLDGSTRGQIAGERRFVGTGFDEQPDRYELEVLGGASVLTVESR